MDGSTFVYYWIIFARPGPGLQRVVFYCQERPAISKTRTACGTWRLWAEVPEEDGKC